MIQFECLRHQNPSVSSTFELNRFPLFPMVSGRPESRQVSRRRYIPSTRQDLISLSLFYRDIILCISCICKLKYSPRNSKALRGIPEMACKVILSSEFRSFLEMTLHAIFRIPQSAFEFLKEYLSAHIHNIHNIISC